MDNHRMTQLPQADCVAMAHRALGAYGLAGPEVEFLGQSENLTFQVSAAGGERYLLRLHLPSSGAFSPVRCQPQAIQSELAWLEALGRDTALCVSQPVRGRDGELVSAIPAPFTAARLNGRASWPVSLLTWVEGEPVRLEGGAADDRAVQRLGGLLRDLQEHAHAWLPPTWFLRPVYGAAFFSSVADALAPGVAPGVVWAADLAAIRDTLHLAWEQVADGQGRRERWGLIHNDLHPGNVLAQGERLCPIDFSLCGFGPYWLDLATSLGSLAHGLRPAFLEGYTAGAGLSDEARRAVEGCLLVSRLSYYAFVLPDRDQWMWLTSRIPVVVETMCRPFLDGAPFLFDIR